MPNHHRGDLLLTIKSRPIQTSPKNARARKRSIPKPLYYVGICFCSSRVATPTPVEAGGLAFPTHKLLETDNDNNKLHVLLQSWFQYAPGIHRSVGWLYKACRRHTTVYPDELGEKIYEIP